jgi:type I restriction enzyme R subunit
MAQAVPQKSLSGVITSEDGLVERPGLELLEGLGWQHINLMKEELGPKNPTGRLSFRELVLPARLGAALRKLNPLLPLEALQEAEIALIANRSAMLPVAATGKFIGYCARACLLKCGSRTDRRNLSASP